MSEAYRFPSTSGEVGEVGQVERTSESASHLKPYPAYKDSGVPWLGEVPVHWKVQRQRNITTMLVSNVDKHIHEGEIPVRLCNYVDVYKNDIITDYLHFMRATASQDEINRFRLQVDDVIITKDSETWDDIGVPALVAYEAPDLVCGYHLAILRPRKDVVCGEFLLRALQSRGVATQHYITANGITRFGLSQDAIKSVWVPLPPLDEQRAIAAFLDHFDHLTRRYIHAQQRLIKLLTEQKQALIQQAVTRGLDPDAPLRDSGIEWLGKVPAHWRTTRLAALAESLQTGPFGSQLHAHEYKFNGTPVVNPSHMKNGKIVPDMNCAIGPEKLLQLSRHRLQVGDIIFARRGELGRCALVEQQESGWLCGTGSLRMRLKSDGAANPQYLIQVFLSKGIAEWLSLQSVGSTMENLNTGILARLPLPLPPKSEQDAIVAHIGEQQQLIDTAITRTHRQITLVREYRTRLIADVVTGKLDVREVGCTFRSAFHLDQGNILDQEDIT